MAYFLSARGHDVKKGNIYPKARARWVITDTDQLRWNAPVWCYHFSTGLTFLWEVLGVFVPILISNFDCSQALWRYRPDDGAIVWRGTWNAFVTDGLWFVEQWQLGDEWVYRRATFRISIDGVDFDIVFDEALVRTHGEWTTGAILGDVYFNTVRSFVPPWLPVGFIHLRVSDYEVIRAAGIDANNTEPATWTYSGLH